MIGQKQARGGGGTRILREAHGDPEIDEPDVPMEAVSVRAALNYIAFGRYEGRESTGLFLDYSPLRIHRRELATRAALHSAIRTLSRSVRTGKARVFEVEERELYEGEALEPDGPSIVYLWEIEAQLFLDGGFLHPGIDPQFYSLSGEEGPSSRNVVFALADIAELADPADDEDDRLYAPPIAEPKQGTGGRKAGTNGAPIARFALRMQALGEIAGKKETQETWGAWLREEYARLGLNPPHVDNAKRDAIGVMRQLWGETS